MMFGLGSFNLINEFERASNEPNVSRVARLGYSPTYSELLRADSLPIIVSL